ncbi:putative baseplate assembly protein [Nodularia spumigena]|nr:putative baseplate assembly protein [Nodularia spumigena]MDB9316997.1 putative baseplate assembly protein [Nodularia spumigena CS-590/01A]MDB9323954.1 putative baseplate assembly protein [Nodularia spumigena CS-591/07A]MDB9325421.1 putative baseplate assembly protein [Nodularia spumigena CS-590/02]MDB9332455.1 putative baseplate assembly protein [Nodularia spumigena CS-591/04]MDB9335059.1 putative baseplate assembly protein [Nodularia spumigena CS-590/01]
MRIPRYCPEWTDHNLSDPGITLIELFAWLTDQMLLRFNQVPRKNYVAFLELLGIRLQPPAPAHTELTFYLSSDLPEAYTIPRGIEVATVRTETTPAITFSTDSPLIIGKPHIQHFLTAQSSEDTPQSVRERLANIWNRQSNGLWSGNEQPIFNEQTQPGNCFYLVITSDESLDGNVLEITIQGASATPTGINPNQPPRCWEAWDGENWQPVLLREADDHTRGFSFYEIEQQGGNPAQGADVRLHLPQIWPVTTFTVYRGRWLRCRVTTPGANQEGYNRPPQITGLGVRSIGGTVRATHSTLIQDERLGISNGKPGQCFQLLMTPVLERRENEYIVVTPPGGLPQTWQEVRDFADSTAQDRHYTIDAITGNVQFGPLIREPGQLKSQTKVRSRIQQSSTEDTVVQFSDIENAQEHQYGAIPPRGAEIRMLAYRTGGGKEGNVQSGAIQFLKSAFPYVASVINYKPAINGADAESLEQAVIRAPRIFRTRDRAVTAEDFEVLAQQAGAGAIARVRCLPASATRQAGTVGLLIVPYANTDSIELGEGIAPQQFALSPALQEQVLQYLDERRLLGVQVQLQEPEYVGVSIQTEVILEPTYDNPLARAEILRNLRISLYKYLNPLTGGMEGKGWPFGRPVYTSDIIALMQQTQGVRYLGAVLLFPIRKQGDTWRRQSSPEQVIDPGAQGLVCSWADSNLRSGHDIQISNR